MPPAAPVRPAATMTCPHCSERFDAKLPGQMQALVSMSILTKLTQTRTANKAVNDLLYKTLMTPVEKLDVHNLRAVIAEAYELGHRTT